MTNEKMMTLCMAIAALTAGANLVMLGQVWGVFPTIAGIGVATYVLASLTEDTCPKCKIKLRGGTKFCHDCGAEVDAAEVDAAEVDTAEVIAKFERGVAEVGKVMEKRDG